MPNARNNHLMEYASSRLGVSQQEMEYFIKEYTDLQVMYRSAIREVSCRLEVLDDEFQFRHQRNPIHTIQTRLKSPQSILDKLGRRNLAPRLDVLRNDLTDIAGVRVICSYLDDIYMLADLLCKQDGVEMVRTTDYIKQPKSNGYRSLHIVVKVPVRLSDAVHQVAVEIQIRTIAMDFWASLEHELRYKSAAQITHEIVDELKDCAENIAQLDARMQKIYHDMEQIEDNDNSQERTEFQ